MNQLERKQRQALRRLVGASYWVLEGGEFAEWVSEHPMSGAAHKELEELKEAYEAAKRILNARKGPLWVRNP